MENLLKLREYVQIDLYTVDSEWVIQLFDKKVSSNDIGASCIWENSDMSLPLLIKEALSWCTHRQGKEAV